MPFLIKRWLYVLATGFILVFFSELLFWGTDSLLGLVETWLFYSLAAYIALAIVAHFRVNTVWSLFLVGAFYGWLVEGVIVQTTYENLPLSLSDTALSWHALITILVGWYAMRRALLEPRPYRALAWGAGIGIFWGLWMPFWGFLDEPELRTFTLEGMALLAGLSVPVLALAYWLQNRWTPASFSPHRVEVSLVGSLFVLQFVVVVVPLYPFALLILPPLLLLVYLALRRHRQTAPPAADYIVGLSGRTPALNYLGVLLIMPAALGAFALVQAVGLTPAPQYAIYVVTVSAGALLFLVSLLYHLNISGRVRRIDQEQADSPQTSGQ